MNFDNLNYNCSPNYSIQNPVYPQQQSSYDYCPQICPPPSQSYTECVPVTRVEQENIPVTTQQMIPVERKSIQYVPQITNDIHHYHETQLQPTILESKQVFTHAGLEQVPQLQKQLICAQQKYEELLSNQDEKVLLLQKKIDFIHSNYEDQLRELKKMLDEKDVSQYKLQKEIQILKNSEIILNEKEGDFKFLEKKISVLKLKNKQLELDTEKSQKDANTYKEKCKEFEKKIKKLEEANQLLQCQSTKFNEQLLTIREQYEYEIANIKHINNRLELENIKLTKKYKKLSLKKLPEKPPIPIECHKENIKVQQQEEQQQILMPIPQVRQKVEKKKPKKKEIKKKSISPKKQIIQKVIQPIKQEIVRPCIPLDPKMPKSVMNLYMKGIDDCTCL